jgi:hypothetical protein
MTKEYKKFAKEHLCKQPSKKQLRKERRKRQHERRELRNKIIRERSLIDEMLGDI